MEIKPKAIFVDTVGTQYRIKEILAEGKYFTYHIKNTSQWFWRYAGVRDTFILEDNIKAGLLFLKTPASKVLYGKNK